MRFRRTLTRFFTFIAGLYFFLRFILPERIGGTPDPSNPAFVSGGFEFGRYHEQILNGVVLVSAMAVGLGLINLVMVHGSKLLFRRRGAINSAALLLGLVTMMTVTLADWRSTDGISARVSELVMLRDFTERIISDRTAKLGETPDSRIKSLISASASALTLHEAALPGNDNGADAALVAEARQKILRSRELIEKVRAGDQSDEALRELGRSYSSAAGSIRDLNQAAYERTRTKAAYNFLNNGLFMPLGSAMFALLGFYIAGAAYRAFRIKSPESGLMMAAALLVMLGQIPFGIWLWQGFPDLRLWLLQVPNAAASRAIEIGAGVAGLVMAFRMWLSIESEDFE